MIWFLADGGTWTAATFGSIAALTNGVDFEVERNSVVTDDLLDGSPIKANAHFAQFCYDRRYDSLGSGETFLTARWSFNKYSPHGIGLSGDNSDILRFRVNDALTNVSSLRCFAEGFIVPNPAQAPKIR